MTTQVIIELTAEPRAISCFDSCILSRAEAKQLKTLLTSHPTLEAYLCGYTDLSVPFNDINLNIIDDQKYVEAYRIIAPKSTHQIYEAILTALNDPEKCE